MKYLLICLVVIIVAILTGTWIFDGASWLFNAIANIFSFMSNIFNFFGWNRGII